MACLNRARIAHETNLQGLVLLQEWARELYVGFGDWLVTEHATNRRLLPTLKRHFAFFETLDSQCRDLAEVTGGFLLDRFGVAGLRVHALPVRYLRTHCSIVLGGGEKAEHVERNRLGTIVARASKEPWGDVVRRYDEWMASKGTAVRTRRLYLSAAAKFCRVEAVSADGRYTSRQIQHFLKSHPGQRANLFKWNAFGREILNCAAEIPSSRRQARESRIVRDMRVLLSKIDALGAEQAPTRLLEKAIAKALGYTVAKFRACAWSVEHESDALWMCDDEERLRVPKSLVPIVVSWVHHGIRDAA